MSCSLSDLQRLSTGRHQRAEQSGCGGDQNANQRHHGLEKFLTGHEPAEGTVIDALH